jgi:glycerophosphoryl diester phosphodiesterase
MQKSFLFLCAFFLTACSTPVTPTVVPTAAPIAPTVAPTSAAPKTLIVAHRGGAALAPENTLAAFANALKLGVDMVECDVHLSKDGELIVMHDFTVSRTTNGIGEIRELTLAELKQLNAAAKFVGGSFPAQPVPTLDEVLDLIKGKAGIQIEIKLAGNARYPGIEKKVIDAVNSRGMTNDVIVISFDFPTLKDVKAIDSRITTGALVRADWFMLRTPEKSVTDAIEQTGADYFMPTASPVNQAIVDAAHARRIKMGVWTVNVASEMERYAGFGIDAITSDRPDELKKILGR